MDRITVPVRVRPDTVTFPEVNPDTHYHPKRLCPTQTDRAVPEVEKSLP